MKKAVVFIFLQFTFLSFAQNQNISNGLVFDGEPYLSIDPNNSNHLVVAWMGWVDLANQFKIKTKTSFNGGQTWSSAAELPHTVSSYSSADPSVAFNNLGEVFICYIDFTGTTPPVTGGVYLSQSVDGGLTWNTPTEVISTNYDGTKWPIDRPWMVIDRSATSHQGNIYVTSMNLNRLNPSFNPYVSVSTDNGLTFSTTYIDGPNWLAGSINPLPMPSPSISSDGTFYASYPSYVPSQALFPKVFLAHSDNQGIHFSYNEIYTITNTNNSSNNDDAKKGSLLICNPADSNHLAFIVLQNLHDELDVYLYESYDEGTSWNSGTKINDDPIGNNRMQDLVWGDFDHDGDLIISWRDRRNGNDSTFATPSEIWAAYRNKDSINFSSNFQLTSETVAYDTILTYAGNDFMCIKLQDDTLNAVWGDTRNGKLNIWYQKMNIDGSVLSLQNIASENRPELFIYPNPASSIIYIEGKEILQIALYDLEGKLLEQINNSNKDQSLFVDINKLKKGPYKIVITHPSSQVSKSFIKK